MSFKRLQSGWFTCNLQCWLDNHILVIIVSTVAYCQLTVIEDMSKIIKLTNTSCLYHSISAVWGPFTNQWKNTGTLSSRGVRSFAVIVVPTCSCEGMWSKCRLARELLILRARHKAIRPPTFTSFWRRSSCWICWLSARTSANATAPSPKKTCDIVMSKGASLVVQDEMTACNRHPAYVLLYLHRWCWLWPGQAAALSSWPSVAPWWPGSPCSRGGSHPNPGPAEPSALAAKQGSWGHAD